MRTHRIREVFGLGAWTGCRAQRALRQAALGYAERGWEVVPGAYLLPGHRVARDGATDPPRCSCRRPDCPAPGAHPADPDWLDQASSHPAAVNWWWSSRPHSIVLPVGAAFEVFDVPGHAGPLALHLMRANGAPVGPVARTPSGRWQFFSGPSGQSFAGAMAPHEVTHHGEGGFLLAPPTRLDDSGAVEWICPPSVANRRLAGAAIVAQAIEEACVALRAPVAATTASTRPRPRYLLNFAHIR